MDFNMPPEIDSVTLSEAGVPCKILSPKTAGPLMNDGVAVTITTYGPDSATYRKAEKESNTARMSALARHEIFDEDRAAIEVLAKITIAWTGVKNRDGSDIACGFDAACKLYTRFPIIRDQVANHVGSRKAFIGSSPGA